MRILVACEESQVVCIEFRKRGHEAFSCDIQDCSGGYPEWHIQDDVRNVLRHELVGRPHWDMVIAFPPCTHLAVSGARHFKEKKADGRQQEAIYFFDFFTLLQTHKVAIENPIGIMSTEYRKPDQIIQPYYFGDPFQKTTCLWLKNLPKLFHASKKDLFNDKISHTHKGQITNEGGYTMSQWYRDTSRFSASDGSRSKERSKTFPGIAKAMATQWG